MKIDNNSNCCNFLEIKKDKYGNGNIFLINKKPHSYINSINPLDFGNFDYMKWVSLIVKTYFSKDTAKKHSSLNFLHLGGGACSVPIALDRIFSTELKQLVIEKDNIIIDFARKNIKFPAKPRFKIRNEDAKTTVENRFCGADNLIFCDIFNHDAITPEYFYSIDFFEQCYRILRENGIFVANYIDSSSLKEIKKKTANLIKVFDSVGVIAEKNQFRKSNTGNIVVFATKSKENKIFLENLSKNFNSLFIKPDILFGTVAKKWTGFYN